MNFLFFFIILPNVLNQNNFYSYEFYLQYNSITYPMELYQNNITDFIIEQFPLDNKLLIKDDNLMSIQLNKEFIINQKIQSKFKKGDIISNGNKISFYYKNIESDLSNNNYLLIGYFKNIDKLIEINDNGENPIYVNLLTLCKSSILSYHNSLIINEESLSFQLFSRNSNPFIKLPYIFFNDNNYDLSKYCSIENNKISILCTFNNTLLQKYKGTILKIIEVVPGCEFPIDTGIIIEFSLEYCETLNHNGGCSKCYSGYYYNNKEKKCKKKSKALFHFLVIGLPIIWSFSIPISCCLLISNLHYKMEDHKVSLAIASFFLGPIGTFVLVILVIKYN